MGIQKATSMDVQTLCQIYDSANLLFPEEERAPGTSHMFKELLELQQVYILTRQGKAAAFLAYDEQESYVELTALYVRHEWQQTGCAGELLSWFGEVCPKEKPVVVKALRNAPWAIQCYQKHGYQEWTKEKRESCHIFLEQRPWSVILCREWGKL